MNALRLSIIAALAVLPGVAMAEPPDSNAPWYPSLMAFEHYDSGRSHLFTEARFHGSFVQGGNAVDVRVSPDDYLTPYNVVYLDADAMFVYGGGYGDKGGIGAFVARIDPATLKTLWTNQLINTVETNEWDYPGVVSILRNGYLYVIYGYRIVKLDPVDGHVVAGPVQLPTAPTADLRDTSYNGLDALPDGTLIAKTVYREKGCEEQGFSAFLKCEHPAAVPRSIIVAIDPRTLEVVDRIRAEEFIGGRITSVRFQGKDYAYVAGSTKIFRYLYQNRHFSLDTSWGPVVYRDRNSGQTAASAVVVMNDWIVFENNGTPVTQPSPGPSPWMTVTAINQADAARQFAVQPFKSFESPSNIISFSPSAVSVDPLRNRVFVLDAGPGVIGVLQLDSDGLKTVWTAKQRTTEFLALIGPAEHRVVVGTDIPANQPIGSNTQDAVVWREAGTGRELARSDLLPVVDTGTMIQPGYAGRMYYMAQEGKVIELTVDPSQAVSRSDQRAGGFQKQARGGTN
ncbi:hypothetical protein [Caballeronia sp. ATUFL_M2_KS44]|uniref:hypothetical protein n=1 Tax=Caballeronia sp. ATUFL_M2_KS44 TaxID=2921767 RepID=UPI0020292D70|nr:hypothetical protein [Caballeronia sp. ATUFL_M2_KS44]